MHTCKKTGIYFAIIFLYMTCMAAGENRSCEPSLPAQALSQGNNVFALNIYNQLRAVPGNLFFSPYSIRTALAMTYAGARGETAAQMKTALNFTLEDDGLHRAFAESIRTLNTGSGDNYEMNVANSLWAEKTHAFLQSFIDINKNAYNGGLEQVDFINAAETARLQINAWVEEQTREKIKGLIPPGGVNSNTRLALVNAVYFKGLWADPFEKKLTLNAPFYCADGRITDAPLMTFSKPMNVPFFAGDGIKLIELDYRGNSISMIILLPDTADGLLTLETRLNEALLNQWLEKLNKQMVSVYLPRFSMNWGAKNIVPDLQALGMRDAFAAQAADFSGIDGTRDLLISSVFHKAFVDVYEEGTEAAAATGVMVGVTSMPPPPEVFRADRPFMFLIREKATGAILFMGRLTEPEKN